MRNSEHSFNATDDAANGTADRAPNRTGSAIALGGAFFRAPDYALSLRHQRQRKNCRDTSSHHKMKLHVRSLRKTVDPRDPNIFDGGLS
ncbi:MAG: hypothetical protein ACLQDM_05620 [Bradyrhizobium sp.]